MMKPTQKQIEQAFERGIKPGAVIRCASGNGTTGVVCPCEDWWVGVLGSLYCSEEVAAWYGGRYATVLAPALEEQRDTLQPGDAVLCGPSMRAAIKEIAEKKGVYGGDASCQRGMWVVPMGNMLEGKIHSFPDLGSDMNIIPLHEFIRRLVNTPVKEQTPEEKLEEAVELINELCSSSYAFVKNENTSRKRIFDKAQAFLKKIER